MKSFIDYTDTSFIIDLKSIDKLSAIRELAQVFVNSSVCSNIDTLVHALIDRENMMSTGIGFNIAVPHAKITEVSKISFAIGISKKGIDFDSIDGLLVNIVILVAAGEDQHKNYLSLLSGIMSILKIPGIKEKIINAATPEDVYLLLKNAKQ